MAFSKINTASEAYGLYKEYIEANSDLSEHLLNQMVVFAIAPLVKKTTLEELFNTTFTSTPYYHRSWYYWKALESSGLASYWDDFAAQKNKIGVIDRCLHTLEKKLQKEAPKGLSVLTRRLMTSEGRLKRTTKSLLSPENYESPQSLWTKGGTWSSTCPMTQILLLKQHLPTRNYWRQYVESVSSEQLRRLETELYHITDPSTTLAPECKREAVRYIRRRLPEVLGRSANMSMYGASWFFQRPIPDDKERWYHYIYDRERPRPRGPWKDPSRFNDFRWW